MALRCSVMMITLPIVALALSVQATPAIVTSDQEDGVVCAKLGSESCAFAVSSSGHRCVLEKGVKRSGAEKLSCRGSLIRAEDNLRDWIETDQCLTACGLDRNSFGVSSDALLDSCFLQKLCSPHCLHLCPNIADLYSNIAAAEGVLLLEYCEAQRTGTRRGLAEVALKSSGLDAAEFKTAPAPAPAFCDFSSLRD